MTRLAFVTWSGLPLLADDDRLAAAELRARGATVQAVAWDDSRVAWEEFDGVILRSCWNYHLQETEFSAWLTGLERSNVTLWNPVPLVRWNMRKEYLRALAEDGVRVVPTRWIPRGEGADLGAILEEEGWREAVVKPTVSASAHETWRTSHPVRREDDLRFRSAAARAPLMVQPFVDQLVTEGEWSLCFVGGIYSHAVRKVPLAGDFRVQPQYGGRTVAADPPFAIVREATAILGRLSHPWLYGRVDGCIVDGELWLMELELLEPSLFLDRAPGAPARFAEATLHAIRRGAEDRGRHVSAEMPVTAPASTQSL
jgi:hypothetical protein